MSENNVTDINKYRTEEKSWMDRYRASKFRKFVGAAALTGTLLAAPAAITGVKEFVVNHLPVLQANSYENIDETYEYIIRPGDTIGGISERIAMVMDGIQHQESVEASVTSFNEIDAAGDIKAGESLMLPVDISEVPSDSNG